MICYICNEERECITLDSETYICSPCLLAFEKEMEPDDHADDDFIDEYEFWGR